MHNSLIIITGTVNLLGHMKEKIKGPGNCLYATIELDSCGD
jgi:hypothetical protein